jgi:hypothetical protein
MNMTDSKEDLKAWIQSNMSTAMSSQLDRWKESAAELFSLTIAGEVVPKVDQAELDAKSKIMLQLVGRAYAVAGGYVENASLSNPQLELVVAAPPSTIRRALSELKDEHFLIDGKRGEHALAPARIGEVVGLVRKKLGRVGP